MIHITYNDFVIQEEVLQRTPLNKTVIVIMDEDPNKYPVINKYPNILMGSVLLPPYEALVHSTEGNYNMFNNVYYSYLMNQECDEFLILIIASWLLKDKDIILYINKEAASLHIAEGIIAYFNTLGLMVGDINQQTMMMEPRDRVLMNLYCRFYLYGIIDEPELFAMAPANVPLEEMVIPKLIQVFHPRVEDKSIMGYAEYFNNLLKKSKEHGRFLRPALSEVF